MALSADRREARRRTPEERGSRNPSRCLPDGKPLSTQLQRAGPRTALAPTHPGCHRIGGSASITVARIHPYLRGVRVDIRDRRGTPGRERSSRSLYCSATSRVVTSRTTSAVVAVDTRGPSRRTSRFGVTASFVSASSLLRSTPGVHASSHHKMLSAADRAARIAPDRLRSSACRCTSTAASAAEPRSKSSRSSRTRHLCQTVHVRTSRSMMTILVRPISTSDTPKIPATSSACHRQVTSISRTRR